MNLAWLSLGALVVAMIVSCFIELNVGVLRWRSRGSSASTSAA